MSEIYAEGNNIILKKPKDFDLREILECGQCFHFLNVKTDDIKNNGMSMEVTVKSLENNGIYPDDCDKLYILSAFGKVLSVGESAGDIIFFNTSEKDFKNIWEGYFDLDTDYLEIKERIIKLSPKLKRSVLENPGIRILKQEFFETTISFIISQNNRIPRIKQIVRDLSAGYGRSLEYGFYSFPKVDDIKKLSEEELKELKVGFRARYILDAACKIYSKEIDEVLLTKLGSDECKKKLCEITGVGDKVANCIMLFSLGKMDAFPIDVWMKKILEEVFFNGESRDKKYLNEFAKAEFGDIGGYVQQYLFAYARGVK